MGSMKNSLFNLFNTENIFSFKGRCRRQECIFNVLISNAFVISFVHLAKNMFAVELLAALSVITLLPICVFWCASIVRRLHDMEMTGWWILLLLVFKILFIRSLYDYQFMQKDIFISLLLIETVLMLYICVSAGSRGFNKYGKDPLAVSVKYSSGHR